jgi:hypothetical protein
LRLQASYCEPRRGDAGLSSVSTICKDFEDFEQMSGSLGSGRWRKPGRRTVDSCPALDVNSLSAKGCLQHGGSGTYPWPGSNGVIAFLHFRCEAERLFLSYATQAGDGERTEIIPIVRLPWRFGGSRPYFICPGPARRDTGAVVCGRRVGKLYHTRQRFLCRQCSKLVYASKYEQQPWQQARRRANKLWRRLGNAGLGVAGKTPGNPEGMLAPAHEHLLEAALQAETQATEAGTARLLQLIERLERRRRIQFTL